VRRLLCISALFLTVVAGLTLPSTAWAHATLKRAFPSYRERLGRSPGRVSLEFDQQVTLMPRSIQVLSTTGRLLSLPARAGNDPRVLEAPVRHLPRGAYTVRWQALSADGHVVSGIWTFGVRVPAPPPSEAYGAKGPGLRDHLVRWGYFLSLALLLGGLAFRLLVVRGDASPAYERRFYRMTALGAVATLEVGILAFLLRAEDALQLPFERLLYGNLSAIADGTRFGTAFIAMTLGYALVAALLCLGWLTDRRELLWAALLVGIAFASGLSLSGHSAVDAGSSWASELADWVHLTAGTIWLGSVVSLAVCVWPVAPELRTRTFLRFSRLAVVLIALIIGAGIYLSVLRLPAVSDLWTVGYGRVLLVKLGLVSLALAWGGVHHFFVRPLLERGAAPAGLVRSLAGEGAVGIAILLAAAILVDSKPPPAAPPPPAQAAQTP
jgi:copper transport protein